MLRTSILLPIACVLHILAPTAASQGQLAYFKASNTGIFDGFGAAIAVSGDTMIVGAPAEDSAATTVDGNQSDNSALSAGAVYVFVRSAGVWSQQAYLKASNAGSFDEFGRSVAICGDTIIVGAPGEDSHASEVDGDQSDNSLPLAGAAYVFVRNGTVWTQQAYLKAQVPGHDDQFGFSVSVSGSTIAVGARGESSDATGVDGDASNDDAPASGAVYVFGRSGGVWSQQAYLKASNADVADQFGYSVSVFGDTIAVGAVGESSSATGIGGNQTDNSASAAGAAYVFVRNGLNWSQQAYLKSSEAAFGDRFGESVSISGETLAVGAPEEGGGAAYVFVRSGGDWAQQSRLDVTASGGAFGASVAVSGSALVVGARFDNSSSIGINGDWNQNATKSGAAYAYGRNGSVWSMQAFVKTWHTDPYDDFGCAVAASGGLVVAGASCEDGSSTGVYGDHFSDSSVDSGAAFVFDLDLLSDAWADMGNGLDGVDGVPLLTGSGALTAGSGGILRLFDAMPTAPCALLVSLASAPMHFKGGTLVAFPPLLSVPLATSANGLLQLPFVWPSGVPSDTVFWFQYAIADPASVHGVSLSNALSATTP
ncbi:MAG: FG-GAP repeat protein [Planctomycetota bacterium]